MSQIKTILFDLDGTIVDSSRDITAAVNFARLKYGLPKMTVSEVIRFVGKGVTKLIEKTILSDVDLDMDKIRKEIIDYYRENFLNETTVYPGVYSLIEQIADNYNLAIVSNKPLAISEKIIKGINFADIFTVITGPETTGKGKPDISMLKYAADKFSTRPNETMMVGDSPVDIEAAKIFECKSCGVTWGFNTFEVVNSTNPDYVIHKPVDLTDYL